MESVGAFGLRQTSDKLKNAEANFNLSQDRTIYNLTLGEPRLSDFPYELLDKLKQVEKINNYYPSFGDPVLRQQILSRYYKEQSLHNIIISHGAIGALDVIMRSKLTAGSEILISDPGFPPYEKLARFTGATVFKYKINLHTSETMIDWESVKRSITKATRIILINSPHNPSGRVFTELDMQFLHEMLNDYPDLLFVMDEVYRDLIYTSLPHHDLTQLLDRGYIVNSFSKIFPMQGARIGWVITSEEKVQEMAVYYNNAYGAISSFGQELAKLLLTQNINYHPRYKKAKKLACSILDYYKVDYVLPEGAFFICVNYVAPDLEVISELEQLGVLAVPGSAFGTMSHGYIRLSFAQNEKVLKESFHIIGQHWQDRKNGMLLC